MSEDLSKLMAEMLSEQGGRLAAVEAILLGVLRAAGASELVAECVFQQLEEQYSNHLQSSTNSLFFQGFESFRDLALAEINKAQAGYTSQSAAENTQNT